MDILTTLVVIIPSSLSLCISGIYAYIALKKAKEPSKDEIWETATKILCSNGASANGADDFADLYEQLKWFKEHGCSTLGYNSLFIAAEEERQKHSPKAAKGSEPQS